MRGTSLYVSKPLTYIGSYVLMYAVLFSGGVVNIPDQFVDNELYIPNNHIDIALLLPNDIRQLTKIKRNLDRNSAITMGDSISYSEKFAFHKVYSCNVYEMWGNTEGLATITNLMEDASDSLGRATFTDEIFVVDKSGNRLGLNKVGYIAGITDNETGNTCENEVIISEDVGYLDTNSRLHLIGRSCDIVFFSNGSYLNKREIEIAIQKKYNVDECICLIDNNICYLFVSYEVEPKNCHLDDIIKYCNELYASHSDEIEFKKAISLHYIPRSVNGKVDYTILKKIVQTLAMDDYLQ